MPDPLPVEVLAALSAGDTIEAIKLLRAATGLGLKEAKDVIDAHLRGTPVGMPASASGVSLPPAVIDALKRGEKLEAIKLMREHAGLGLKEAKDAVEASQQGAGEAPGALSPGEVGGSSRVMWVLVVIAAVLAAGYLFLRG